MSQDLLPLGRRNVPTPVWYFTDTQNSPQPLSAQSVKLTIKLQTAFMTISGFS